MKQFTKEEMEKCFEAGANFARDMFRNPSNSKYIQNILNEKKLIKNS